MDTRSLLAGVLAAVVIFFLAACADAPGEADAPGDPGSAGTSVSPVPGDRSGAALDPFSPPPPSASPAGETVLTGEVVEGVEAGCVLLRTDDGEFLLLGEAAAEARVGTVASVRGEVRSDLLTICQQGTPFEVTEVIFRFRLAETPAP